MSETKDVRLLRQSEPAKGWTLSTELLNEVARVIQADGWYVPTIEVIEIAMLEAERRILAALEPAPKLAGGEWVLVPREPTEAMKELVRGHGGAQALAFAMAAWPDMLSAAPPPPSTGAVDVGELVKALTLAEHDQVDLLNACRRYADDAFSDLEHYQLRTIRADRVEDRLKATRAALAAYKRSATDGQP